MNWFSPEKEREGWKKRSREREKEDEMGERVGKEKKERYSKNRVYKTHV